MRDEIEAYARLKGVPVRVEAADPGTLKVLGASAYAQGTVFDRELTPTLFFREEWLAGTSWLTAEKTSWDYTMVLHELGHASHFYDLWRIVRGDVLRLNNRWGVEDWSPNTIGYLYDQAMHGRDSVHGPRWKVLTKRLGHPYPSRCF